MSGAIEDKGFFAIGTRFIPLRGKEKREEIVEDIWKTYNSKGELVKVRYICSYEFCGQRVRTSNPRATLARAEHLYPIAEITETT